MSKREEATAAAIRARALAHGEEIIERAMEEVRNGNTDMLKVLVGRLIPAITVRDDRQKRDKILKGQTPLERIDTLIREYRNGMLSLYDLESLTSVVMKHAEAGELEDIKAKMAKIYDLSSPMN